MRLLLKWLLFAGMSMAVAQVFALSSANLQQSNTPLSVALLNSPYPPYVLSPEQGSGIVLDILRAYSEATGQPLKIQYAPEVRTLKLIQTQQVDARIESETWFLGTSQHCWSLPLLPVEDVVVTSSDTSFQHIEQLRGAIFFGRFGYTYPAFENAVATGQIERRDYYSELELLIAVAKAPTAQAHFGVVAKPTLDWYQKRSPLLLERVKAGFVVGSAPLQLQFAANDEATKKCQAFNEFLTDFIGSEAYRKILRQYQPQT